MLTQGDIQPFSHHMHVYMVCKDCINVLFNVQEVRSLCWDVECTIMLNTLTHTKPPFELDIKLQLIVMACL